MRHAASIGVCFDLLVGRFVRPLVVLTYYAGYHAFGTRPIGYHVFAVALHSVNAWLLYRVARALDPAGRVWPALGAGLLFLTMSTHSEAVTWVAGLADPFAALFLLLAVLTAGKAFAGNHPMPAMYGAWLATALALLGKESAAVVPPVVIAYGLAQRAPLRRIALYASVPVVVIAVYAWIRFAAYGNPVSAYGGLGGYTESSFAHARALLLRTFLPGSRRLFLFWVSGLDVWAIAGCVMLVVLAARYATATILFSIAGLLLTLAPAFPLSVSLQTTESERMLYIPSAFAALLAIRTIDALARRRIVSVAMAVILIAGHALVLQRMNGRWRMAGEEFDAVTGTLTTEIRQHGGLRERLAFVLSMPDSVHGAYVYRRGFYSALDFYAPDLAPLRAAIVAVESQDLGAPTDPAVASRRGPMDVALDVHPNQFLSLRPPVRPFYAFPAWSPNDYLLRFSDAVGRASIFYVSQGRAQFLGELSGPGAPFGAVDIPADGATCSGAGLRFAGWALDDRGVMKVVAVREDREIGAAAWMPGARPDVAVAYAGFPDVERAGWEYELPCTTMAAGTTRISIQAVDGDGHKTALGVRTVRRLQ